MADVDPVSDTDVYTKEEHFRMDYAQPRGWDWRYQGCTLHRFKYPEDPRLHFNAGAAAYRATNYSGAIRHFSAVLSAQDIRLQAKAYYNLGNVYKDQGRLDDALAQYRKALALQPSPVAFSTRSRVASALRTS